jgi:hypothetical protein
VVVRTPKRMDSWAVELPNRVEVICITPVDRTSALEPFPNFFLVALASIMLSSKSLLELEEEGYRRNAV